MEKVYAHREFRLEANIIGCATYEVKIGKFEFADVGQLGGYVVSCNHLLRKEGRDNPTIGLLICKEKVRFTRSWHTWSRSTLVRHRQRQYSQPDIETLARISKLLNVGVEELFNKKFIESVLS